MTTGADVRLEALPPLRDILVVKPSSLGDIVHTLPAVALLKRRWSAARVRWIVNSEWAPLLEGNPDVDEVIEFPRRKFRGLRGLLRVAPWARSLRERAQSDLVLDFQGLLRSALMSRLCRRAGGRIIGLADAREGSRRFYDAAVDTSACPHAVDRYLALVRALGAMSEEPLRWCLPAGTPPDGYGALVEPFVVLHPFSRGKGKSLAASDVAAFARALAPVQVVLAGRSDERAASAPNLLDFLNRTTLPELIYLLRRARFIVSVDSGPMHIAAALTDQLVSIHTWSDPAKVGPYRDTAWVWRASRLFQQRERNQPSAHLAVADIAALGAFVASRLAA
jgi:lipopolysaccharide heptosyltransferase I